MPRNYKKKTDRIFSPEPLKKAIKDVRENNMSIRKSAAKHGISKSRLFDYFKKTKNQDNVESVDCTTFRKSQVFPPLMEAALAEYLIKCSTMLHGLTPKATKRLAYECDNNVPEGRFIIVRVYGCGKLSGSIYVAKVVKRATGGYDVEFYKSKMASYRFIQTNEEEAFVTYADVVLVLPVPSADKRPRFQGMIYFNLNLDEYRLQ